MIRNNWELSEIYLYCANILIVFALDMVYNTHSFTKRGKKYENG